MSLIESYYLELLRDALEIGEPVKDRTGVGTLAIYGAHLTADLTENSIPLLTSKYVSFRNVASELLWFLSGSTNVNDLPEGVNIWDAWADSNGDLGPTYGAQWREQIPKLEKGLRENPTSRRHVVSAWNPQTVDQCALPPCHILWQVHVHPAAKQLSLSVYQRSGDLFLGVPYNLASYGLLTHMLAATLGYRARRLNYTIADAHLYESHREAAKEQLARDWWSEPRIKVMPKKSILDYTMADFELTNYDPLPAIKAPVAI